MAQFDKSQRNVYTWIATTALAAPENATETAMDLLDRQDHPMEVIKVQPLRTEALFSCRIQPQNVATYQKI